METWPAYCVAESALLERRRAQRGFPTLGDEADHALLGALAALPAAAAPLARGSGERLGASVWSRRYHEDALPGGIAVLSEALAASGVAALRLESGFHRSARVRYEPAAALERADAAVRAAFLEGALEGFLSSAYNCAAHARAVEPDALHIELGEARDVNRGGPA